jgi:hypothetical protein
MRKTLALAAAALMVLVPVGTGAVLALFPEAAPAIPVWFWVVWFLVSVWAALDAPVRVEWLPAGRFRSTGYARTALALAVGNVVLSIAAVVYLGWWI